MYRPVFTRALLVASILSLAPLAGLAEGQTPELPTPVTDVAPAPAEQRDFYRELLDEQGTEVALIPATPKLAPPASLKQD